MPRPKPTRTKVRPEKLPLAVLLNDGRIVLAFGETAIDVPPIQAMELAFALFAAVRAVVPAEGWLNPPPPKDEAPELSETTH